MPALSEALGHMRDLPRYREILTALIKYGYRDVAAALHLEAVLGPLERLTRGHSPPPADADRPHRLRLVCEELGPTFVKLGQLLSTRPDLLPESYLQELGALRDDVKPFPFPEVEAILRAEWRRPWQDVLASLDPEPVASASISQVHHASLPDGRAVALKIRRPLIEKIVQADLDIVRHLAELAQRRIPWSYAYRPVSLAKEFERSLRRELDLDTELRTMQRCAAQLESFDFAHVPAVFPELSTERLLVMEFIAGADVDDMEAIRNLGADPREIAQHGAQLLMEQIFTFGFFHADPHPGNLRVLPGGIIAPLDYGLFGSLDLANRESIADLLAGLLSQDVARVLRALDDLEIRGERLDPRELRRDVAELVAAYSDLRLDRIDLARLLSDLIRLIRTHHLRIPPDLLLLVRSLITIESVGRKLDPHFDISRVVRPHLEKLARSRYSPRRLLTQAARASDDLHRIVTLLPDVLGRSLESIERGELKVQFDLQHMERLVRQLARAGNTLAIGITLAGLFIGSALLHHSPTAPRWLSTGGFLLAAMLGLRLVYGLLRDEG
jgi:ubiquinone biosynthesis protein